MLYFKNSSVRPRELEQTNWWGLPYADKGYIYVTFNAGEFRVLLPHDYEYLITAMRCATRVDITRGPWEERDIEDAISLVWEDGSNNPLAIQISAHQFDGIPYQHNVQLGLGVTVLCRTGQLGSWPARFFYCHPPIVDVNAA